MKQFKASYAACHPNMTVLAKYCRAIVDGTKKAEGRPCNRKYAKVKKGNYLNLGVAWNWIIVVVVSRNVQPTCEKMVEVCGWDALVPESGSNYSCTHFSVQKNVSQVGG